MNIIGSIIFRIPKILLLLLIVDSFDKSLNKKTFSMYLAKSNIPKIISEND